MKNLQSFSTRLPKSALLNTTEMDKVKGGQRYITSDQSIANFFTVLLSWLNISFTIHQLSNGDYCIEW